jgi:predicted ATP-grasp superfamily ATP-dependent carboligase
MQDVIIAKDGVLSHLIDIFENLSNHIIVLENESEKSEKFSFEISKSLLERGNFEEIKKALKEAINFDLYEDIRPIKLSM